MPNETEEQYIDSIRTFNGILFSVDDVTVRLTIIQAEPRKRHSHLTETKEDADVLYFTFELVISLNSFRFDHF